MLKVTVTKMNDLKFEKNLFNPLKTGRKIDEFFSSEGGVMPGTNTVVTGDPGVGKTTVLLDILADMHDSGKRVLFVSGEMNAIDMVGYVRRFPKFGDLPILFMGEQDEEDPIELLRTAFQEGYDCLLIQQVTKSGAFAGSNRIKHMTTGMAHMKFDSEGGRFMAFSKNRRGGNMNKYFFNLNTKNQVNWMYEAPANMES